jgi:NADP-dependent 3-hydroxy acid dehydrogenase YdfG
VALREAVQSGVWDADAANALLGVERVDILINVAGNPGGRRGPEVTLDEYEDLSSVHCSARCCATSTPFAP